MSSTIIDTELQTCNDCGKKQIPGCFHLLKYCQCTHVKCWFCNTDVRGMVGICEMCKYDRLNSALRSSSSLY